MLRVAHNRSNELSFRQQGSLLWRQPCAVLLVLTLHLSLGLVRNCALGSKLASRGQGGGLIRGLPGRKIHPGMGAYSDPGSKQRMDEGVKSGKKKKKMKRVADKKSGTSADGNSTNFADELSKLAAVAGVQSLHKMEQHHKGNIKVPRQEASPAFLTAGRKNIMEEVVEEQEKLKKNKKEDMVGVGHEVDGWASGGMKALFKKLKKNKKDAGGGISLTESQSLGKKIKGNKNLSAPPLSHTHTHSANITPAPKLKHCSTQKPNAHEVNAQQQHPAREVQGGCEMQGGGRGGKKTSEKRKHASELSHPFKADYNDHFETSLQAYTDIAPLLDLYAAKLGKTRKTLVIYDPYFCAGSTVSYLNELGFAIVHNTNTDCYKVWQHQQTPMYDVRSIRLYICIYLYTYICIYIYIYMYIHTHTYMHKNMSRIFPLH